MTDHNNLVLVVDDEFLIAQLFSVYVEAMGMTVCGTAATADDAIALANLHRPAIVLMDMRLKGKGDGVDAALAIYESTRSKVIFITGSTEPSTLERIKLDHASGVLIKPVSDRQLRAAIESALAA